MTRRVRSGSSQKHKKMPGNATKWGEFDNPNGNEFPVKKKKTIDSDTNFDKKLKPVESISSSNKIKELSQQATDTLNEADCNVASSGINNGDSNMDIATNKVKKHKRKRNSFDKNSSPDEKKLDEIFNKNKKIKLSFSLQQDVKHNNFDRESKHSEELLSQQHEKKKRKKKKKTKQSIVETFSPETSQAEMSVSNNISVDRSFNLKQDDEYSYLDNNKLSFSLQQDVKFNDFHKKSKHSEELLSQQHEKKKRKKKKTRQSVIETFSPETSQSEMCVSNNISVEISSNLKQNDSKHSEELLPQQHEKKKRKKKKNKQSVIETLSPNTSQNEMSASNNVSVEISSNLKQDDEHNCSDKTSDTNKSLQNVDVSFRKQKEMKHHKLNSDLKQPLVNDETSKVSTSKNLKKERYLKNLQKKREKLGLLLLPPNSENKLRKLKKRLIEKGFPPEMQKEIMRKARRKEELNHRKIFNPSKLCFNCREAGHVLADCPKKSDSVVQETGICFKCGSLEHTSFKCPKNVQGFPFAKCFICKEQGHISRNCSKNKRGIYPKGGRCNLCGNVNHLRKDCPTLKKKENEDEEEDITLHTISKGVSIDDEMVIAQETKIKPKQEAKIVKF